MNTQFLKSLKYFYKILICFIIFFCCIQAQSKRILTYDEAIEISLTKSYTIKSHKEKKTAMEYYFNFYKAQFKPRLDFNLFAPKWDESVTPIQQTDALPVYNSTGTFSSGGELEFTFMLPTGGSLGLSGTIYSEELSTVLVLENYKRINNRQAYNHLSLTFNQPIFTTNILKENLNEAQYKYEKSINYFSRSQMDIVYQVTVGYYTLYKLTREMEINKNKLKNSEEAYRISKLKAGTGRIPEGDNLIAEVNVAQNRANLSEAINKLEREKDKFKQLIGVDLVDDFTILTDLKYNTFSIDLNQAIEHGLKMRPEIEEAELDVKLQEIDLDRANRVSEFKGNISAYYDLTGISTEKGNISELLNSSFKNFFDRPPNRGITLSFSYPIHDWGRGSSHIQQEEANLNSVKFDLENTKVTIIREIRDIVRSVEEAKRRLEIYEKNKIISERSYDISSLRFENGDITNQELALEQERLADSQLAYLEAFITYQLAVADLKRKTLWDFEKNKIYTVSLNMEKNE